jgi:hypothetical protein
MTMKLKRIRSPKAILMTVTIIRFYSILYFDVLILPFLNLGKEYSDNIRKYLIIDIMKLSKMEKFTDTKFKINSKIEKFSNTIRRL